MCLCFREKYHFERNAIAKIFLHENVHFLKLEKLFLDDFDEKLEIKKI